VHQGEAVPASSKGKPARDSGVTSRISVVPVQGGRFTFLVDGQADVTFDKSWGVTSYPTEELARKAGEYYLRQRAQAASFAAEIMGSGPLGGGT
jgi:hypothetical protein